MVQHRIIASLLVEVLRGFKKGAKKREESNREIQWSFTGVESTGEELAYRGVNDRDAG